MNTKSIENREIDLQKRTIVIWGAGNTAKLYYEGFKRLENERFKVDYYTDSESKKWGGGM